MKQVFFLHIREVVSPPTKRNVTASRRILNRAANRRRHRNTNCNYDSVLIVVVFYLFYHLFCIILKRHGHDFGQIVYFFIIIYNALEMHF